MLNGSAASSKTPRRVRDLHLCAGLFLSPFVLVFAVSAMLLNHTWRPWEAAATTTTRTTQLGAAVPDSLDRLDRARWIAAHAGIDGEIQSLQRHGDSLVVQVGTPGRQVEIRAHAATGGARIAQRETSFWDRLHFLHKSPGPHLAGFRGNWIFMRLWRGLTDLTVGLLLFSGASGVYLWTLIRAQRRTGMICGGIGVLVFLLLIVGLAG